MRGCAGAWVRVCEQMRRLVLERLQDPDYLNRFISALSVVQVHRLPQSTLAHHGGGGAALTHVLPITTHTHAHKNTARTCFTVSWPPPIPSLYSPHMRPSFEAPIEAGRNV